MVAHGVAYGAAYGVAAACGTRYLGAAGGRQSVEALRDYAAELKAEMARVEAVIAAKEAARLSADSFFKA